MTKGNYRLYASCHMHSKFYLCAYCVELCPMLRQYYQIHKRALEPPEAAEIMSAYCTCVDCGMATRNSTLLS